MVVVGTRPEAIKLAPVILGLRDATDLEPVVVVTGQHREILDEVLDLFRIVPDHDLAILRDGQSLTHLTAAALEGVGRVLDQECPDAVVVQGDTTTTFTAALAAFYRGVPIVHVEAGLRSRTLTSPFPEEANRQLTSRLATLHLCPTPTSRDNLLAEGIDPAQVLVTGNTVIDALHHVIALPEVADDGPDDPGIRTVLVTAHRRESWGGGLARIAEALRSVVAGRPDVRVLFPIHPNPVVREAMVPVLGELPNVDIVDPLPYRSFARAMARSYLVVTDSGGVQEEAPSLGVPVLVTRRNTERPEAVTAGAVALVGDDPQIIAAELTRLLDDPAARDRMARSVSPYGDGRAAPRAVQALRLLLFGDAAPEPFVSDRTT